MALISYFVYNSTRLCKWKCGCSLTNDWRICAFKSMFIIIPLVWHLFIRTISLFLFIFYSQFHFFCFSYCCCRCFVAFLRASFDLAKDKLCINYGQSLSLFICHNIYIIEWLKIAKPRHVDDGISKSDGSIFTSILTQLKHIQDLKVFPFVVWSCFPCITFSLVFVAINEGTRTHCC